jgi:3-isopropylmalate dehydratase small subunit
MADDERSYPALSGRAWCLPETWAGEESLPRDFTAGDFLVCHAELGRGAANSVAAELRRAGVAAMIAPAIAPAFFAAALAAGLPAVAIEEAAAIKSGDRLRLDIEIYRVANRSSGDRYIIKNLSDESIDRLRRVAVAEEGGGS